MRKKKKKYLKLKFNKMQNKIYFFSFRMRNDVEDSSILTWMSMKVYDLKKESKKINDCEQEESVTTLYMGFNNNRKNKLKNVL